MIHPTAIISEKARLADNISIGPYSVIGDDVEIGAGSQIGPHVVINGPTVLGKNTRIFQFASIGEDPQDLKFHGERAVLEMGDNNTIREFVTINRGTEVGGGITKIGNNNLFMAYVHIAHDCIIGNNNIFANNASLSGHVIVGDFVTMGGLTAVHQFTRLGSHSFMAGGTMTAKDILPYVLVAGNPAEPYGLNSVGLQRRGYSSAALMTLRKAYKIIFRQGLVAEEAIVQLVALAQECPEVQLLIDGLQASERGIARETRRNVEAMEDLD
ncbi:MAG: acyl-ACP--UDP-N-acetylglucosamine O-acyltransferase [Gammaproteobacteria bacterium]|nr:acyl-ACP--UDP-N-acetylglucosamine O-acyltransferase [Gammaproteobacteria bacterium]